MIRETDLLRYLIQILGRMHKEKQILLLKSSCSRYIPDFEIFRVI